MAPWMAAAGAAGLLSALLYTVPLLNVLAQLPLFASGLSSGPVAAGGGALLGTVLLLAVGGVLPAAMFLGFMGLPVAVVSALATGGPPDERPDGRRLGGMLAAVAGLGTAAFLAFAAWAATGDGVAATVRSFRATVELVPAGSDERRKAMVEAQAAYLPAFMLGLWTLLVAINGALGQAAVTRLGRALRATPPYSAVRLPDAYDWAPVAAMAVALAAGGDLGYTARNAALVLLVPHFLQGLAVAHVWARRLPSPGAILGVFYVTVLLLSVLGLAAVTVLGFIETRAGLREQAGGPGGSQGEA